MVLTVTRSHVNTSTTVEDFGQTFGDCPPVKVTKKINMYVLPFDVVKQLQ